LPEASVQTHLHREVEQLKHRVLELGALVEESLQKAVAAVARRDVELARAVTEGDNVIDRMEVDIEEDCLQVLALYQPVATDLRFIVSVLKLNNDLERIGDLAVNIAKRGSRLAELPPTPMPFDFEGMSRKVQRMLAAALDALVNMDPDAAREVCAADTEVDNLHRDVYRRVQDGIMADPSRTPAYIPVLTIARHLERIADHATNIAEDVIYTVEGEISRHGF
jgi:phosphate transport system protein